MNAPRPSTIQAFDAVRAAMDDKAFPLRLVAPRCARLDRLARLDGMPAGGNAMAWVGERLPRKAADGFWVRVLAWLA